LITLLSATFTMLTAGTQYTFSLFGPQMAQVLGYSHLELASIAAAASVGHYLSAPMVDAYVRHGPRKAWIAAAVLLTTGYAGFALLMEGQLLTTSPWLAALFSALIGVGATSACTVAATLMVRRFPWSSRGAVFSLALSFMGLAPLICALSSMFWFSTPAHQLPEERTATSEFLFCMALAFPAAVTVHLFRPRWHQSWSATCPRRRSSAPSVPRPPVPSLKERLVDPLFWCLWLISGILIGVCLMYINSIGSMAFQLAGDQQSQTFVAASQVAVFGLSNFLSRLVTGPLSDYTATSARISRLWFIVLAAIALTCAQAMTYVSDTAPQLLVASSICGFAFGMICIVLPTIASELWDIAHVGRNTGLLALAPAAGGQIFTMLFGALYDRQLSWDDGDRCIGSECYRDVFYVAIVSCLMAIAIAV
ncbi:major facilitator superfamily domain-containing protein, partial [Thamnocephalis sphaerospora]